MIILLLSAVVSNLVVYILQPTEKGLLMVRRHESFFYYTVRSTMDSGRTGIKTCICDPCNLVETCDGEKIFKT